MPPDASQRTLAARTGLDVALARLVATMIAEVCSCTPLASGAALQNVTARHLQRQAMLYVRQSTLHQVVENTESTARQYALRDRALALGWHTGRIVVIDQDLGQSGASAVDRAGFQRLVAEVGLVMWGW